MQETLQDHHTSISICGDVDLMGGSNGELQDLTNTLVDRATAYGMEVSTDKSKIKTNSTNNISADISMNGQMLEKVTNSKYLAPAQQKSKPVLPQQTKQDLEVQHYQLCKQVQALQVSCHIPPLLRL